MFSTQKELQTGETTDLLVTMWFETKMGEKYRMPDMMRQHVTEAHKDLDQEDREYVHVQNVSNAILMIPKRIINRAGVGERCFWESI